MKDLIILLMQARTLIHSLHLNSHSHSEHMALDELYNSLTGHIDTLTETYQGVTEEILILDKYPEFSSVNGPALDYVRDVNKQITQMRTNLSNNNSVIQNLIDELQQSFYKSINKLKFLK
jgi:DNA-binding ferritin-like protein